MLVGVFGLFIDMRSPFLSISVAYSKSLLCLFICGWLWILFFYSCLRFRMINIANNLFWIFCGVYFLISFVCAFVKAWLRRLIGLELCLISGCWSLKWSIFKKLNYVMWTLSICNVIVDVGTDCVHLTRRKLLRLTRMVMTRKS